jgi:hypothetical protein
MRSRIVVIMMIMMTNKILLITIKMRLNIRMMKMRRMEIEAWSMVVRLPVGINKVDKMNAGRIKTRGARVRKWIEGKQLVPVRRIRKRRRRRRQGREGAWTKRVVMEVEVVMRMGVVGAGSVVCRATSLTPLSASAEPRWQAA